MKSAIQYSLVAMLGTFLVGCGGGSSSSGSSVDDGDNQSLATLSGRAAVGAPIAGATVSARCTDGSGFINGVTTDSNGSFSGRVESDSLPCALRVTGGSEEITLHSFSESSGTINITPLTDMIIALSSSVAPKAWFERDDRNALVANLELARREMIAALGDSSYELPDGEFDPFRTPFTIGDTVDRVLDALWEAIAALPTVDSYPAFLDLIAGGNLAVIPEAPPGHGAVESPDENGGAGGGGDLPVSGDGSAAACFSPLPASPGAQLEMRMRSFDTFDEPYEFVMRLEDDGETTFRGETVRVVNSEMVSEEPLLNLTKRIYVSVDEAALVLSTHGDETINPEDGSVTGTGRFEPTEDFRYDLNPGESFRQIYTYYIQSPDDGPTDISVNVDTTVTYFGRETITVPAGTFETCKFYIQDTGSQFSSVEVTWKNVGDGVEVQHGLRDDSGTESVTMEMLAYSVN